MDTFDIIQDDMLMHSQFYETVDNSPKESSKIDLSGLSKMVSKELKAALVWWYDKALEGKDNNDDSLKYLCLSVAHQCRAMRLPKDQNIRGELEGILTSLYGTCHYPFGNKLSGPTNPERFRFAAYAAGVPYPEQSFELTKFYRDIEARLKAGDHVENLCREAKDNNLRRALLKQFRDECSDGAYPFGFDAYMSEQANYELGMDLDAYFKNPARCRWVAAHTNTPNRTLGCIPAFYPWRIENTEKEKAAEEARRIKQRQELKEEYPMSNKKDETVSRETGGEQNDKKNSWWLDISIGIPSKLSIGSAVAFAVGCIAAYFLTH